MVPTKCPLSIKSGATHSWPLNANSGHCATLFDHFLHPKRQNPVFCEIDLNGLKIINRSAKQSR